MTNDATDDKEALALSRRPDGLPVVQYIVLPALLLLVTLLGGVRMARSDNAFVFIKPPLICLVFAALTLLLFARSRLIDAGRWFRGPATEITANSLIGVTLFTATCQIYNSLLPESGLAFWVVGFCIFWTLWTDFYAEFDARRLMKSLTAIFGLAFVVRYLVLAGLSPGTEGNWLRRLIEDPGREAFSWLLDLPNYSAATGYLQFFTLIFFLTALFLLPQGRLRNST